MSYQTGFLTTAAAAVLCGGFLGTAWSTADSADQATLAGEPGPGPYVRGCVDCHTEGGAENLGALLAGMGHKNVDKMTESVPGDCAECHSDDGGYSLLSELSHMFHYDDPARNVFIRDYGGNCLHCHALDAGTGAITVKTGPKNW